MGNVKVYSRSNVAGNPSLWRPLPNNFQKDIPLGALGRELTCDNENDYITTYTSVRTWNATLGIMVSPPYVECDYVE